MGKKKKRIEDYLSIEKWYHGTTLLNARNIINVGIKVDYNKGNELDFGYGFYLTPNRDQAERYITKTMEASNIGELDVPMISSPDSQTPVVIEFNFKPLDYYNNEYYNFKILNSYDQEFAEFIFHNRVYNVYGDDHHDFDFIFGVMSDSLPIVLVQEYKSGVIDKEKVIKEFQKATSVKQMSIHRQDICDILTISNLYEISSGKELKIDD